MLMMVARCIDAFTDVTMGQIVDRAKEQKDGRFRPWIRRMCGPVALASFLMYQSALADASMTIKVVYMFVTYILWGSVFYTSINIPYGLWLQYSAVKVMTFLSFYFQKCGSVPGQPHSLRCRTYDGLHYRRSGKSDCRRKPLYPDCGYIFRKRSDLLSALLFYDDRACEESGGNRRKNKRCKILKSALTSRAFNRNYCSGNSASFGFLDGTVCKPVCVY